MKPFTATLLATALSAALGSAYAQTEVTKPDTAAYHSATQKAAMDYKAAAGLCKNQTGNARLVCTEDAKASRARAELAAVTSYNSTLTARTKARTAAVNADYALSKAKCAGTAGAEKDSCLNNAHSVQTAALANVKLDRDITVAANVDSTGAITNTTPADPVKAAAVDKCAQVSGSPATGCLIDNKDRTAAMAHTTAAAGTVANRTETAVDNMADKTRAAGATVAAKTERAVDTMAAKTERAADTAAIKTDRAAEKTGVAVADSVITTKVKADIFKEPELKSMAIHVETEKGIVMLSGFVDSKADAEKAVRLAKSVDGVSSVKSAIKVK